MRFTRIIIGSILGVGLIITAAYQWFSSHRWTATNVRCEQCNVIVIAVDPLREDGVHALGNPRNITPAIDALTEHGFVFTNAVAVSSWTLPSTMSFLTGVYPSSHKIINKELIGKTEKEGLIPANLQNVSPGILPLASVMKSQGYATGGFTGGAALDDSFGFAQGFDTYYGSGDFEGLQTTIPKALDFIKTHQQEKLFVFLQGFDTHGQYVPPEGYTKRFAGSYGGSLTGAKEEQKALREQRVLQKTLYLTPSDVDFLRALYDEKVARADQLIGQFIESYRSLGLMDKTILVITSSHGEEFYEHGGIDHGMTLFDELLRVPLIILFPKTQGRRIDAQVRTIDVMPTIFSLAGLHPSAEVQKQIEGTSLVPLMLGQRVSLDAYPETDYRYAVFLRALRTSDGWKLIYDRESGTKHLFNLTKDFHEQQDLIDKEVKTATLLFDKLQKHIDAMNMR